MPAPLPTFTARASDSVLQVHEFDPSAKRFVSASGQTVSLRKRKPAHAALVEGQTTWTSDESYGVNVNTLLDRIEGGTPLERPADTPANESSGLANGKASGKASASANASANGTLWTEKWRPHKFLDLVGNEHTNRRILAWLRQWAPTVFDEPLPDALPNASGNGNGNASGADDTTPMDPLGRPTKRILLIHGPPGVGKTSVSHVVARQAGYSVVEINASDERAGERVRLKVQNALFNHTFNSKPVCLVADEIDGSVENGFIRVLLDIIKSDSNATKEMVLGGGGRARGKARARGKSQGKNKNKNQLLTRPIVAICNNLYAPALEKLRPHCEIIAFRKPSETALLERLELVCKTERVPVSKAYLKDLAVLSQGDVRNCLNNLQFRARATTSTGTTSSGPDDGKDIAISWYRICNSVFRKNPHMEPEVQLSHLLKDVETSGNHERVVEGCWTMYPETRYSDHGVSKPARISDWLFFHDRMFQSLFEHNGELVRYCSFTPLQFFVLFADNANKEGTNNNNGRSRDGGTTTTSPGGVTSLFELREAERACMNLLDVVRSRLSVHSQVYTTKRSLLGETLPAVEDLISVDLSRIRDVPTRQRCVDTVLPLFHDFRLRIQEQTQGSINSSSSYTHLLVVDPPLDELVLMDEKRRRDVVTKKPAALKFSLAKLEEERIKKRALKAVADEKREQSEQKRRRMEAGTSGGATGTTTGTSTSTSTSTGNFMEQYNSIKKREVTPEAKDTASESRIWVKYKEGFSNAVRKNVTWSQLWEGPGS
ncbi:chromosome transmission fidelity protein 18 [Kluyveromyces marxianus]|uniref:Chromosome transmission fidelity protein 18 n=2 Tax=Kluyveromyces marxianus TaxID=4911 RepID=W0T8I8_KLUMD|nr:chromosome transmission fidelity protein 18 [Kluyveromyces marxianus DMKU3-1042]QGN15071.1 chromosome transmission fidelity protein 18 [Kluyveromyces marxianus]BAO39348.1 chromosome transmission fidelity protein 18 [Kluyveromyces marxianus DMKU3-1042]